MKHFIVATAGHVDHGKSALVRALTGTDPDRLPEEKARGITIDLGFAHLALPGLKLGLVDVPGHEDFVKNMVSGVGAVDLALLVVAADDGWMPQTEEHLQILSYLGVRRAVVALTKIDLAQDEVASVATVRGKLAGSPFADAPIVPTSMVNGRGVETLQAALGEILADAPPPRDIGKPRLPVDRVFALRGVGTIVTGTLTGGTLNRGQVVTVQPSGRTGHVRSVQNHGRDAERGIPGTRTALNLPELDATGDAAVARGEVVTLPELGDGSLVLDVMLYRVNRAEGDAFNVGATRPFQNGKMARLHLGSGHWTARVNLLNRGKLAPGDRSVARLRCERPVFALAGDRFILRDGTGRNTLAGGVVLDPEATRWRAFRRGAQRRFLEQMSEAAAADAVAAVRAAMERDRIALRAGLLRRSVFSAAEIDAASARLTAKGTLITSGDYIADAAWWHQLKSRAMTLVDTEHRERPEKIGLPLTRLRSELGREFAAVGLFNTLLEDLTGRGDFVQVGASLRRGSHRPTLPAHLQAAGERLRIALAVKPFEPPSRAQLTPDGLSRQALRFLFDTGEALEFGEEIVLLEESFRRMKTVIVRTLRSSGAATASDLRQVLGTTRRVLIPVLERLDQDGITRREGDRRSLR